MTHEEWAALRTLNVFESITFRRIHRQRTAVAATALEARELIENAIDASAVEVSRTDINKYVIKLTW